MDKFGEIDPKYTPPEPQQRVKTAEKQPKAVAAGDTLEDCTVKRLAASVRPAGKPSA